MHFLLFTLLLQTRFVLNVFNCKTSKKKLNKTRVINQLKLKKTKTVLSTIESTTSDGFKYKSGEKIAKLDC